MPKPKRLERWHAMMDKLRHDDINRWRASYLQALDAT
jgi:trehalose 6-phosphate synthase